MIRAALYVRVSTDSEAEEGYSIAEQTERLKAYCTARGMTAAKVYTDAGFSGSNLDRPGIAALMRDINKYKAVIVYKLDRLSRSQKDTLHLIEDVFLAAGVDFISVTENFDTGSPFGRAMIGILSVFAQLEREQIRERLMLGRLGAVKNGRPSGTSNPPYGYIYKDRILQPDPVAAPIVQRIYKEYLSGRSITAIMDTLNNEGHIGKAIKWSHVTIRNVLTHVVYTGRVELHGKIYPGAHEPLISEEDFNRAAVEVERRQKEAYEKSGGSRPFQSKYMLSGLLFCGRCGKRFGLRQSPVRKDGGRAKRYYCYTTIQEKSARGVARNPSGCNAQYYQLEELESLVMNEIEKFSHDPTALLTEQVDNNKDIMALEERAAAIDKSLERIVGLYIRGDLSEDLLDKEKCKLQEKRASVLQRREKLKQQAPDMDISEAVIALKASAGRVGTLDYNDKCRLVRLLISKIILDGDTMTIQWRFRYNY